MQDARNADPRPQAPRTGESGAELRALKAALAEAEALSSAITHELRSPVGAIVIVSTLLAKEHAERLDESGRALLARLTDCARNTSALMDRLMLYARVREQRLDPSPVDLRAEVLSAFSEQLLRRRSEPAPVLTLGELPSVEADRSMVHLLLANLLENAIKCTSGRPQPAIEVSAEIAADQITCVIRDNGIGFDPQQVGQLFKPFGRVHAQVQMPGSGLGLAIVREIARRHGGHVSAEAVRGQGATFRVTLLRGPCKPGRRAGS